MEPFAGARAPRPLQYLDEALPPPRTVYEAAIHPILESLLQTSDDTLQQVVSRLMPADHVISASMKPTAAGQEIWPMVPMGADFTHTHPRRAYIHAVEYDFRFTYAAGFYANVGNVNNLYNQRALEHPPDNKIGLRIALVEVDHAFDFTIGTDGELTTLGPLNLEDLLVRPNRRIDGHEQPWTSGPTSVAAYYSPWRKSRDLADVGPVSTFNDPAAAVFGTYYPQGLVGVQGDPDPASDGLFQRVDTRPSPYTYRVLWETWEERAPQRVPSRWPAMKIGGEQVPGGNEPQPGEGGYFGVDAPSNVNGFITYQGGNPGYEPGFGNYFTRGSLTEERWRMHIRGSIPLRRSYWWTSATAGLGLAFTNTRGLYWIFIPKGSCCIGSDEQDPTDPSHWSGYMYPTPQSQSVMVRQLGSIEDVENQDRFGLVKKSDAYISRAETQQAQMGERRYDIGQQRDHYQRGDRG